jgi:hypothetical protein
MHELRGYVAPARRRLLRVLLVLGSALPAKASSDGKNGRLGRASRGGDPVKERKLGQSTIACAYDAYVLRFLEISGGTVGATLNQARVNLHFHIGDSGKLG